MPEDKPEPTLVIVWDPDVIGPEKYAQLVKLLGDLARADGAVGIERLAEMTVVLKPKRK